MSRRRGSRRLPVAMRTGRQVTKEQKKESSKTGNKRKRYHGNREQVDRNSWAGKRRTGGQMLKDWEHDYRSQEDWDQKDRDQEDWEQEDREQEERDQEDRDWEEKEYENREQEYREKDKGDRRT